MNSTDKPFRAYLVDQSKQGSLVDLHVDDLPAGEVLIRASHSSLNYKDALAATGHPGVARTLPHIPGVDVAGTVESSSDDRFQPGDAVFVTGYELGAPRWGGWSQKVRVPADWVIPIPRRVTPSEVMALGTAGFTAAQCVSAIQLHDIGPDDGEVLVTGASGGVGSTAVALLAKLGYQVAAVTGKEDHHQQLRDWGASRVLPRETIDTTSDKPLLKSLWAAAVDTVGGNVLAGVIKQLKQRGCVAACGNVAGVDLPLTVFPFILRGVKLDGIDSAQCPRNARMIIWEKLFGSWKLEGIADHTTTVPLTGIDEYVQKILKGQISGRVVVDLNA
ncbi:YhdH/YhfP family quinone oxidoreductase [Roseimaritima ulvae]|uniref:Putative acrylyl-CoA reductase AcuI n=1 Tax=Roseimaritima ulvae TaxID=980254 RepID=A0A5B9R2W7_9BACT|nr:YhdH/YhfP family quinone oxidoreductase [Roseimaritima ulvae]QEG40663.1 putative acrylyl-CoA reductase AcuI [Roseimaritima ulvae]